MFVCQNVFVCLENHLKRLDGLLRQGKTEEAFRSGDEAILIQQLNLSENDVNMIRHGVAALAHWRTSARSSLA